MRGAATRNAKRRLSLGRSGPIKGSENGKKNKELSSLFSLRSLLVSLYLPSFRRMRIKSSVSVP